MKHLAQSLGAVLLAACATPQPQPVAPPTSVQAAPAAADAAPAAHPPTAAKPAVPDRFADPPLVLDPGQPRDRPPDLPGPGYHCHWIGPGKRFCHSGID